MEHHAVDTRAATGTRTAEPDPAASHAEHLERAVALAVASVADAGGPFGAVVVTADGQVVEGDNRVTQDNDPTAHAEVTAVRRACAALGTFDLTGATLYSSCEPCPMCLATALWARVDAVYFAADRHDAAAAGFDDAAFYDFFAARLQDLPEAPAAGGVMTVRHERTASAVTPFDAWRVLETRVDY
ncbi:nucleoside deaminase [Isoptericola cucumis]|uniref:tRNA-specific adenosine deaminase n=1 Tax=Isoptericola cucumis TaxID=1776856 RepID=A0ABQ2B8X8_9MICO|nr:nucleoside deaminase [Isoptericola cucumis]GGI08245.1 tRNA-specific adenosine deaminase [Isoptericola cucumis]